MPVSVIEGKVGSELTITNETQHTIKTNEIFWLSFHPWALFSSRVIFLASTSSSSRVKVGKKTRTHRKMNREKKENGKMGKVHGILNASSKICSLVVNGQSFLVTDGSLLNLF